MSHWGWFVLEKGKHARDKEEKIKNKTKKQIISRLIILVVCLICVIVIIQTQNQNKEVSVSEDTNIKQEENEEEPVTPVEDEEIKNLIAEIKTQNNLNDNNFAFFYYNPQTQEYYFDNQEKYFKGASTVKVPIAMIYYDKIRNGEITKEDTLQYTSDNYEPGGGTTASKYKVGSYIPIGFLLEQSIINSDNTAVNTLIDGVGYRKCRELMAQYSDEEFIPDF